MAKQYARIIIRNHPRIRSKVNVQLRLGEKGTGRLIRQIPVCFIFESTAKAKADLRLVAEGYGCTLVN